MKHVVSLVNLSVVAVFFALVFGSNIASAHVKWFSKAPLTTAPIAFPEVISISFWFLFALSIATIVGLVWAQRLLASWPRYQRLNRYLDQLSDKAPLILRVTTGASLLLSWQAGSMIAPEIKVPSEAWGWLQFALCLLLLTHKTTPIAGIGMICLYALAWFHVDGFHLADYLVYPAIGYFLAVSTLKKESLRQTQLPVLYIGLGFSLCWVALEKIFFPSGGLDVIAQAPTLTMGLDPTFFLLSCAFVEFSLGYLLMICLLERPLAATITLVFLITTCFFGKTEVIGHTLLHGALLVFVILGNGGYYRPPFAFHKTMGLRMAFAGINFILLFVLLAVPYRFFALHRFERMHTTSEVSHN